MTPPPQMHHMVFASGQVPSEQHQHQQHQHQHQHLLIEPRSSDILCGKDKLCVDHEGSRRFRTVIECYKSQYQQALTKFDKTSVTREIYDALCTVGSRFLKFSTTSGMWEEVTPTQARDKIGHALRFANRSSRRAAASAPCLASALVATPAPSPASTMVTTVPVSATPQSMYQAVEIAARVTATLTSQSPSLSNPVPVVALPRTAQESPCSSALGHGQRMPSIRQDAILDHCALFLTHAITPFDSSRRENSHQTQQQEKFQASSTTACGKSLLTGSSCATFFPAQSSNSSQSPGSSEDGSFSLLEDIFPLNQQLLLAAAPFPAVHHSNGAGGVSAAQSSSTALASTVTSSSIGGILDDADFDFDAEILSVLV